MFWCCSLFVGCCWCVVCVVLGFVFVYNHMCVPVCLLYVLCCCYCVCFSLRAFLCLVCMFVFCCCLPASCVVQLFLFSPAVWLVLASCLLSGVCYCVCCRLLFSVVLLLCVTVSCVCLFVCLPVCCLVVWCVVVVVLLLLLLCGVCCVVLVCCCFCWSWFFVWEGGLFCVVLSLLFCVCVYVWRSGVCVLFVVYMIRVSFDAVFAAW